METQEYEDKKANYVEKLITKIEEYNMTPEQYTIFLLQGIKKELITIRRTLTEK